MSRLKKGKNMKKIIILLLILMFNIGWAKTIVVYKQSWWGGGECINGDVSYTTISEALNNVESGDVIKICPGTYQENLSIDQWYHNNITIESATNNKDDVIIEGKFIFSGSRTEITIQNLTIDGGLDNAFDVNGYTNLGNSSFKNIDIFSSKRGINLDTIENVNFEKIKIRAVEEGIYIKTQNSKANFYDLDIISENAPALYLYDGSDVNISVKNYTNNILKSNNSIGLKIDVNVDKINFEKTTINAKQQAIFIEKINVEGIFNDFNIETIEDKPAFHIIKAVPYAVNIGTKGDSSNHIVSQNGSGIKIEESVNDFNLLNTVINSDKEGVDIGKINDNAYFQDINISSYSKCINISEASNNLKIDTDHFTYNNFSCKQEGVFIESGPVSIDIDNTFFDIDSNDCGVDAIETSATGDVSVKNSIFKLHTKSGGIRINNPINHLSVENSKFKDSINEVIYVKKVNNNLEINNNIFTPGDKDSTNNCIVTNHFRALEVESGSAGGNIKNNMFNEGFDYALYFPNEQWGSNLNVLGNCFYQAKVYTKRRRMYFDDGEKGNFWSDWSGEGRYLVQQNPLTYYDNHPLSECPMNSTDDICYQEVQTEGCISIPFINCSGGVNCKKTVPIKNISNSNLYNVHVYYDETGLGGTVNKVCGVEPNGSCEIKSNISFGIFGFLGSATEFIFSNPIIPNNTNEAVWQKALGGGLCFGKDRFYVEYIKDGVTHRGRLNQCTATAVTAYKTGPFDAWDTFRDINDRNISTKIVNKEFNLTIASINNENNDVEKKENIKISFALYDKDSNSYIFDNITNSIWYDFNCSTSETIKQTFNISKAYKEVGVLFRVCADYNGTGYILYSENECSQDCASNNEITSNNPCFRKFMSSDRFAIRPYGFRVFGNNEYKRAGEEFNLTIKAVDENNFVLKSGNIDNVQNVSGYNEKLSNINIYSSFYQPTTDEIRQMNIDVYNIDDTNASRVASCPNHGTFEYNKNYSFVDGEVNATLKFSETGILNINVSEINGSEFAKVDADDTNDSQRLINPAIYISDRDNINKSDLLLFIPYQFRVAEAEYNSTIKSKWVYMSNSVSQSATTYVAPKMAAYIRYKIVAQNKDGAITKNFTKTCFPDTDEVNAPRVNGLKLNTTFDLFLDMNFASDENIDINLSTFDQGYAVWTPINDISLVKNSHTLVQEWIGPKNFNSGIGEVFVYFNIPKDYNQPHQPTQISIIDINTSTSWMNNPGATKIFIGKELNSSLNFYYGRINAPDYTTEQNSIKTPIYVEVFCNLDKTNCSKYGIDTNSWKESVNDVNWWINPYHIQGAQGQVNQIIPALDINGTKIDTDVSANPTSITSFTNGENRDIIINYTGSTLPHKTRIFIDPDEWLKYHPFFTDGKVYYNVTFKAGGGSWSGVGNVGKTVDYNASQNQIQRIEW